MPTYPDCRSLPECHPVASAFPYPLELTRAFTISNLSASLFKNAIINAGFNADGLHGGEDPWQNFKSSHLREASFLGVFGSSQLSKLTNFFRYIYFFWHFWVLGCLHSWVNPLLPKDRYVPLNSVALPG